MLQPKLKTVAMQEAVEEIIMALISFGTCTPQTMDGMAISHAS